MDRLKGKTVLITGGTSGIGLATAKLFRAEGAQLVVTGRDQQRLTATQEELGSETLVIQSEAGNLSEVDTLIAQVKNRYDQLDVLFLNAAVAAPAPIELVSEAQYDEIMNVNLKGVFFTIQKALPLLSNNASIIVTTSITNRTGAPNFSVYAASKAALHSLVQSLGLALIGRGIRVNAINPGLLTRAASIVCRFHRMSSRLSKATLKTDHPSNDLAVLKKLQKLHFFLPQMILPTRLVRKLSWMAASVCCDG